MSVKLIIFEGLHQQSVYILHDTLLVVVKQQCCISFDVDLLNVVLKKKLFN